MPDPPRRDRPAEYSLGRQRLVLGVPVPPPEVPPRLADMGKPGGPPLLPPVHTARRAQTLTGVAPPPRGTPRPPERTLTPPELPAVSEPPAPSEQVPIGWDTERERDTYRRAVEAAGGKLVRPHPAEITPVPETRGKGPSSLMAAAERFPLWRGIMLLTALFGGATTLVTQCGNEAVKLVEAWRRPSNEQLEQQTKALRADVDSLLKTRTDALETKARQKKDGELSRSIEAVDARLKKLESEPRVQTVQGLPSK